MKPAIVVVGTLLAAAAAGGVAHAEDEVTYEVEGEANAGAADARTAALDDAFGRAAKRAVDDMVAGAVRIAKKQDLDREILGHARLWVAKFSVVKDTTDDDRRQLTVSVRVDREKMRARLAELGIDATAGTPSAGTIDPASKARGVAILLRVTDSEAAHATYGTKAAREVAGAGAITNALKAAGYAPRKPATAKDDPPSAEKPELDDADAAAIATAAKADFALAAAVVVDPPAPVRGVATSASLVSARVKLVDAAGGKSIGGGAASFAFTGDGAARMETIDRAVRAALGDVVPAPAHVVTAPVAGFHGDDTPIAEPGTVLVRLPGKTPWSAVLAEQKFLLHGKGVTRAAIHRLSPGGWIIGVATGLTVEQVASLAKRPPAADTSASVRVANGIVEVALTVTAPAAPPPP